MSHQLTTALFSPVVRTGNITEHRDNETARPDTELNCRKHVLSHTGTVVIRVLNTSGSHSALSTTKLAPSQPARPDHLQARNNDVVMASSLSGDKDTCCWRTWIRFHLTWEQVTLGSSSLQVRPRPLRTDHAISSYIVAARALLLANSARCETSMNESTFLPKYIYIYYEIATLFTHL